MSGLGSEMSGITLWNPDKEPDKVGWDLATEELGLCRTCLARVIGTRIRSPISLAKLVQPKDKKEPGHVWAGGWTCLG
jgi:hypothetical protein